VMISESTRLAFTGTQPDLAPMEAMEVRGRQAKVVIWATADEPGSAHPLSG
jgi:hypothetical protein